MSSGLHSTSSNGVNGSIGKNSPKSSPFADWSTLSHSALFLKRFLASPTSVGALVPSSRKLARRMASLVPHDHEGWVIELGAGTGVITSALLDHGVSRDRFLAVDRCPDMIRSLRHKLPQVTAIHGDATQLEQLLETHFGSKTTRVNTVVSSLPMRVLPQVVVDQVQEQFRKIIPENGTLIQFTYDLRPGATMMPRGFVPCKGRIVWGNFPPARIEVFRRKGKSHDRHH